MKTRTFTLEEAMNAYRSNGSRKYPGAEDDRSAEGLVFPSFAPSFTIKQNSSVFTIGSCFARNVEEALVGAGMDVPSLALPVPDEERIAGRRVNFMLNQYNPGTMCDIVKMTVQRGEMHGGLYEIKPGMFGDALLSGVMQHPVAEARSLERRKQVVELYRDGLKKADVAIVTLGLVEAWYDMEDEVYLNTFPGPRFTAKHPDRLVLRQLGVEDSFALLAEMVEIMLGNGVNNIVLTVSPVPLASTFTLEDAVVANSISKSTLRVVAEQLSRTFDAVDYFPSYEIVTTSGLANYNDDQIHVRSPVVNHIVRRMIDAYTAI